MSITLASLRATLRLSLLDTALWPDTALDGWLKDGLADYSNTFPYTAQYSLPAVPGEVEYDPFLPGPVLAVLRLELLTDGEDQGVCLLRMEQSDLRFSSVPSYDVIHAENPHAPLIRLGQAPDSGLSQGLRITYQTVHPLPANETTLLTLPDSHGVLLVMYARWQALLKLEASSAIPVANGTADPTSLGPTLLGESAARLERSYRARMNELRRRNAPGGFSGPWSHDT